jgi:hypothetical protein
MVQTESLTTEGYGEMCRLLTGEETVADNAVKAICCLKTSCTADDTQTSAGVTKSTESGLTIANATITSEKTTATDDTIQAVHTHTAGESASVLGAGLWNDAEDKLFALVCYAATVAMESSDTLKNTFKIQLKAD